MGAIKYHGYTQNTSYLQRILVEWLMNFQTSLGKVIKYEACRAFYRFFRNEFNEFNKTGARMLNSNYHMMQRLL